MGVVLLVVSTLSGPDAVASQGGILPGALALAPLAIFAAFLAGGSKDPWSRALDVYDHTLAGRHKTAVAGYNRVIPELRAQPGEGAHLGIVHAWRAISLASLGWIGEALNDSERAMELAPDEAQVNAIRALVLLDIRKDSEAVRLARRAASLEPDNAQAHSTLAAVLWHAGDADGALASIDRAIALAESEQHRREWRDLREKILKGPPGDGQ